MPLIAGCLLIIVLFTGLGVDAGMLYAGKAKLNKGVDSGALAATQYFSKPDGELRQIVYNMVKANAARATLDPATDITIDRVSRAPAVLISVRATMAWETMFMRVFALLGVNSYKNYTLRSSAEAIRFPIMMGLIVDRSGSMSGNAGAATIQASMPGFLARFAQNFDRVGIYSYSSTANREMSFRPDFLTAGSTRLAAGGIAYGGNTGPADALRMCLQDMQTNSGFNQSGVRKIIVFLTDGQFNTFRARPPNTMGAFDEAPSGVTASVWSNRWFGITGTPTVASTDSGGLSFGDSNLTVYVTNTAGTRTTVFTNLDAMVSGQTLWMPVQAQTNTYLFPLGAGRVLTNRYAVDNARYGNDGAYTYSSSTIATVNSRFKIDQTGNTLFNVFRFRSAVDGQMRQFTDANSNAEANNHVLRYCDVARKTATNANRITIFTIGYTDQVQAAILKSMANVSGSGPPYSPIDATQPYDDTFGFTLASNQAALTATLDALGKYLSTRLTK